MKYVQESQNLKGKYMGLSAVDCARILQSYFEYTCFYQILEGDSTTGSWQIDGKDAELPEWTPDVMGNFEYWWNEYIDDERDDQGTLFETDEGGRAINPTCTDTPTDDRS